MDCWLQLLCRLHGKLPLSRTVFNNFNPRYCSSNVYVLGLRLFSCVSVKKCLIVWWEENIFFQKANVSHSLFSHIHHSGIYCQSLCWIQLVFHLQCMFGFTFNLLRLRVALFKPFGPIYKYLSDSVTTTVVFDLTLHTHCKYRTALLAVGYFNSNSITCLVHNACQQFAVLRPLDYSKVRLWIIFLARRAFR